MLDIPSKLKKGNVEKERKSVGSDTKAIVNFMLTQRYFINIHMTFKSVVSKQLPGKAYYAVAKLYNTFMWKESLQKILKECIKNPQFKEGFTELAKVLGVSLDKAPRKKDKYTKWQ